MQSSFAYAFRSVATSLVVLLFISLAEAQTTERVSVSSAGAQGGGGSGMDWPTSVSADGRWVSFASLASNLVPGDTNGVLDVLVRDRLAGTTVRVSVATGGGEGNSRSGEYGHQLSADGRFIAFGSDATNLVAGDGNSASDVFVHDLQSGETTRVSVDSTGVGGDRASWSGTISADGRWVLFTSTASNFGPLSSTSAGRHVYAHDRVTGATARISVSSAGVAGNGLSDAGSISADGRWVAFTSDSTNLVLAPTPAGSRFTHIYLHDRDSDGDGIFDQAGGMRNTIVDASSPGIPSNGSSGAPVLTSDGRWVAFSSGATNLVANDVNQLPDVFVTDLITGVTTRVSDGPFGTGGNGSSTSPSISADGRVVAFASAANDLVPGDSNLRADVFFRDLQTGVTERAGLSANGAQSSGESSSPAVSATGRVIAFVGAGDDLVDGDSNGARDVFARILDPIGLTSISPNSGSEAGGEIVRLYGIGFGSTTDTTVRFGGALATLVDVTPGGITVRTPPGSGVVDVAVTVRGATRSLPQAYTYVAPWLAARYGNVNVGRGDRENVLLVNAVAGDSITRELTIGLGQRIDGVMLAPSSRPDARFVLYLWGRAPNSSTLTPLPLGLGAMALAPPFAGGAPLAIWNNIGRVAILGAPTLSSRPAPSIVFRSASGSPAPVTVTLQGLIEDDGSQIPRPWSVTNAIVLRLR